MASLHAGAGAIMSGVNSSKDDKEFVILSAAKNPLPGLNCHRRGATDPSIIRCHAPPPAHVALLGRRVSAPPDSSLRSVGCQAVFGMLAHAWQSCENVPNAA